MIIASRAYFQQDYDGLGFNGMTLVYLVLGHIFLVILRIRPFKEVLEKSPYGMEEKSCFSWTIV
jgi:hypothetical protein